jgi:exosortase
MTLIYIFCYVLIIFFVGLVPFNFFQTNKASVNEISGLHLAPPSTVYTEIPPEKLSNVEKFSIIIDLSSYLKDWSSGYTRILSYSLNNDKMNFMVGQWSESLIFRINADNSPKTVQFETEWFFNKYQNALIAIVYDGKTLTSYRNGQKVKEKQVGQLTFKKWNKSYPLIIGSEADGKNSWQGYIYSMFIFDRALTVEEIQKGWPNINKAPPLIGYNFKGSNGKIIRDVGEGKAANLEIPYFFKPYKRTVLDFGCQWMFQNTHNYVDLWIDIIGFMPLGFLLAAYLTKKRFSYFSIISQAVLIGASTSLSIELLQVLLPTRASSLSDVICNSIGTLLGAIAYKEAKVFRSRYLKLDAYERGGESSAPIKDSMQIIASIDNRHILFMLACLISLSMFYTPLRELMRSQYASESYLHVILIPLISGYLIYEKWETLTSKFSYSWKTGSILMCVGLIVYFVTKSKEIMLNKNDYASLITLSACIFLMSSFILLYGLGTFRAALFPLLFIIFMIPIPTPVLKFMVDFLKSGSTELTNLILKLIQIPFERQGYIFSLTNNVNVEVADVCSGIHSTIALIIISILAGHLFLRTAWRKTIFILFVFPIVLVKNGIRITVLSLLGAYVDERILTQGFLHKSGGFVFYIPALILLLFVLWLLKQSEKQI